MVLSLWIGQKPRERECDALRGAAQPTYGPCVHGARRRLQLQWPAGRGDGHRGPDERLQVGQVNLLRPHQLLLNLISSHQVEVGPRRNIIPGAWMLSDGIYQVAFLLALYCYIQHNHKSVLEYYFRLMKIQGVTPNPVTYCSLVNGYSKAGSGLLDIVPAIIPQTDREHRRK